MEYRIINNITEEIVKEFCNADEVIKYLMSMKFENGYKISDYSMEKFSAKYWSWEMM